MKYKLPKFTSKAFFAPMAGVSDPALRLLCKELGAGLVVTEFANIHAVVARSKKTDITQFIPFSEEERPLAVQLFGSDLSALKKAVVLVNPHFDIIDYNLGCPAPHVTKQMACSALLQEPELVKEILEIMVSVTKKPVTIKLRVGITKPDKFLTIAKIAEAAGISMITLHPRTVKQGYSGKADWSLIKKLKQSVKIPVVGNGDIQTPEDAKRMLQKTGCDYVMVGRAAAKNPFLFKQINQYLSKGKYEPISDKERIVCFLRYLDYTKKYPTIKFANIRMQAMNFTRGIIGGKKIREQLGQIKNNTELKQLLNSWLKKL